MPQFFQKIARNEVQKSKSKEEIQIKKNSISNNSNNLNTAELKSFRAESSRAGFLNLDFLF